MVDIQHAEERQQLMAELQLLAEELPEQFRHRMMRIILGLWSFIEKVEVDGVRVENDVIRGMISKMRDR